MAVTTLTVRYPALEEMEIDKAPKEMASSGTPKRVPRHSSGHLQCSLVNLLLQWHLQHGGVQTVDAYMHMPLLASQCTSSHVTRAMWYVYIYLQALVPQAKQAQQHFALKEKKHETIAGSSSSFHVQHWWFFFCVHRRKHVLQRSKHDLLRRFWTPVCTFGVQYVSFDFSTLYIFDVLVETLNKNHFIRDRVLFLFSAVSCQSNVRLINA